MIHPLMPISYILMSYSTNLFFNSFISRQEPVINPPSPKKVSFHDTVELVLIPERQEFINAGLDDKLWEKSIVHENNRMKVRKEIQFFKENYAEDISAKRAFNLIYDVEGVHPANLKSR